MTWSVVAVLVLAAGALAITISTVDTGTEQAEESGYTGPPPIDELPIEPGSGPVPTYGPTPAPNGCELIPTEMLLDQGWKFTRDQAIMERSPDPAAPVSNPVGDSTGGVVSGISGCAIAFENRASVQLSIKRPPHDEPRQIQSSLRLERERHESYSENGWRVFPHRDAGDANMAAGSMSNGTDLIEFQIVSPMGTQQQQATRTGKRVVSEVITNWDRSFTGANIATYPKPYGDVPDPCRVLTAADFTEIVDAPDSGMLNRDRYPGFTEVARTGKPGEVRYVEGSCFRSELELDGGINTDGTVDIRMRTYRDERAAGEAVHTYGDPGSAMSGSFGGPTPVNETVGDSEAFFSPAFDGRMVFRSGRHMVGLKYSNDVAIASKSEMIARQVSVGRKIAARIAER